MTRRDGVGADLSGCTPVAEGTDPDSSPEKTMLNNSTDFIGEKVLIRQSLVFFRCRGDAQCVKDVLNFLRGNLVYGLASAIGCKDSRGLLLPMELKLVAAFL